MKSSDGRLLSWIYCTQRTTDVQFYFQQVKLITLNWMKNWKNQKLKKRIKMKEVYGGAKLVLQ